MTRDLGNLLYPSVNAARGAMFVCAEQAQLTYLAFELAAKELLSPDAPDSRTVSFPVGLRPDKTAIPGSRTYSRDDLLQQYQHLAVQRLSINGLSQLVTVVEAMLEDVIKIVVVKYPRKLGSQKKIDLQIVLEASSLVEVHAKAVDGLLNELAYKSPKDFAKEFEELVGPRLLEGTAFHRYVELKATRDVFMHNRGIANVQYTTKSGSHARVSIGRPLPCDTRYFLECYETCLQLSEWLEGALNEIWPSSDLENYRSAQLEMQLAPKKQETDDSSVKELQISKSKIHKINKQKKK